MVRWSKNEQERIEFKVKFWKLPGQHPQTSIWSQDPICRTEMETEQTGRFCALKFGTLLAILR